MMAIYPKALCESDHARLTMDAGAGFGAWRQDQAISKMPSEARRHRAGYFTD